MKTRQAVLALVLVGAASRVDVAARAGASEETSVLTDPPQR